MSGGKAAELLCRERRKQKFVEMEQAIDALAAQTKDMNSLQSQHQRLQVLPACIQPSLLCCRITHSLMHDMTLMIRSGSFQSEEGSTI